MGAGRVEAEAEAEASGVRPEAAEPLFPLLLLLAAGEGTALRVALLRRAMCFKSRLDAAAIFFSVSF